MDDRLEVEVAAVAGALPAEWVGALCGALESLPAESPEPAWSACVSRIPVATARGAAARLVRAASGIGPDLRPADLAFALRAAAAAHEQQRGRQRVELAWTGPAPAGSRFRRLDQALIELIDSARRSLLLVTFVSYRVAELADALARAVRRGVRVRLVVESAQDSGGRIDLDPALAFGDDLARGCEIYAWPADRRPRDALGRSGALHAKCAAADGEAVLVSSANLTGHAMTLNMEMGLVVRGPAVVSAVEAHFDALVASGELVRR